MLVCDIEGTELLKPDAALLQDQPHLVEFAGIKLDDNLVETGRLHFLCNPGVPLPELFTKITHITQDDIKDAPSFTVKYPDLVEFFLGQRELVAHNLSYDESIIKYSLMRIDKLLHFPWPPVHICTADISATFRGYRLGMADLHQLAAGELMEQRIAFAPGQLIKHKTLGHCTVLAVEGDKLKVQLQSNGKERTLKADMFKGRAAFEGAHGAMRDAEELVTIVRWMRKEGHL